MTPRRRRWTLAQAFLAIGLGALLLVGGLLYGFLEASRRTILDTADALRASAAVRVESLVTQELGRARMALDDVDQQIRLGVIDVDDPASLERALFATMVDEPALSDVTFTRATPLGYDDEGHLMVAAEGRSQLSVYRQTADGKSGLDSRRIAKSENGTFVAKVRARAPGEGLAAGRFEPAGEADDPTLHPTFVSSAQKDARPTLWSDLHWSELDRGAQQRVVLTVQRAITRADGTFLGVLRVGLLAQQIDDAVAGVRVEEGDAPDPHRVFLCDPDGRLVSRAAKGDRIESTEELDLRYPSAGAPPEIAAALRSPMLARIAAGDPTSSGSLVANGQSYLATFRSLMASQDWVIGIVVPERHYTARIEATRDRFLAIYAGVMLLVVVAGALTMRAVRRGLGQVHDATAKMRGFDFGAGSTDAPFGDVQDVLESLERAKTAMRALGKYAPMDLVKELYRNNQEPVLGGELTDVTVMFTDIEGFTSLSERVTPNELAVALGRYLEAMASAIRAHGGTIDKFIGDAVMALWNAPTPRADHPILGCRAALACKEAARALFASEAWRGLPPLVTRYGLHTDRVLVGHFGEPERMSYTALGDGVNLAARLEGLGKQYGCTVLVSEAVERAAAGEFDLRRLDRVAVKGKSKAVLVFELLGAAGTARGAIHETYEAALDLYFARRFDEAIERLAPNEKEDPPSRVLAARCRELHEHPPPEGWDGVYVAKSK